jgi:hypothetical protein
LERKAAELKRREEELDRRTQNGGCLICVRIILINFRRNAEQLATDAIVCALAAMFLSRYSRGNTIGVSGHRATGVLFVDE